MISNEGRPSLLLKYLFCPFSPSSLGNLKNNQIKLEHYLFYCSCKETELEGADSAVNVRNCNAGFVVFPFYYVSAVVPAILSNDKI